MKAFQQEKLLPAILSNKGQNRPKLNPPEFTGTINVNSLIGHQKNPLDARLEEFEEPKNDKNRRNYSNIKEERFYRLNRDNKLRINEEISNYLKSSNHQNDFVKKIHIRSEMDQIKDAAKQLDEINYILEQSKRNPPKKDIKPNSIEGLSFLEKKASKNKVPSQSNLKHLCTKGLRHKMARYNITNSSKKFTYDPEIDGKNYFSQPNVLNAADLLKKITNQRNKSAIRNAIDTLNNRLVTSKEKIIKDYEASIKKTQKYQEDFTRKGPRYKSINDVKLDKSKIEAFENEIKAKKKLTEDPKEMKVIFKNDVFNSQESEVQIDKGVLSDKVKKYFQISEEYNDLKITPVIEGETTTLTLQQPQKNAPTLPPREMEIDFDKIKKMEKICHKDIDEFQKMMTTQRNLNSPRPKKALKSPKSPKTPKTNNETSSIAVGNEETINDLEKTILSSNYLSREFHMDTNFGEPKSENIVNWADKFKIAHSNKKWSRDLEYFLS